MEEVDGLQEETAPVGVQSESPIGIQGSTPPEQVTPPPVQAAETHEEKESDLRLGQKEAANNPDVMSMVETAEEEAEEVALPSFFIEPDDRQRIEIDILYDPKKGKIVSISRVGMGLDFDDYKYLVHTVEWLEFSPPSYDNMATYRTNSTTFRPSGQSAIDRTSMRNFLLVRHLKDWSFRDRNGEKAELTHKDNGALDDESIKKVYSVPPTIVDVILTIFEKDILLT